LLAGTVKNPKKEGTMKDAAKIKAQKKVKAKVTPQKALQDLDHIKDDQAKGVTGGWADLWTPTPAFRRK